MNKPSFLSSTTSLIVFLVALAVTAMGLYGFYKTGEVIDIFNSLFSMVMGAYFQRSLGKTETKEPKIDTSYKV